MSKMMDPGERNIQRFVYKNLLVMSLIFLTVYTAYNPLENLQTSLHSKGGLGFITLTALYSGFAVSSLFLPSVLLYTIGHKWSTVISLFGYFSFICANYHGTWATLIPTAAFMGICWPILWCAGQSYIQELAGTYSGVTGIPEDKLFGKFYPIFYGIYKSSQISGNVVPSTVLRGSLKKLHSSAANATCGPDFCPSVKLPTANIHVTHTEMVTLVSICVGFAVFSLILTLLCLDRSLLVRKESHYSKTELMLSTIKEMKDYRMLLLAPVTLFSGLQAGFLFGDFNEAYITCYLGVDMVGLVMISYGICSSGSAIIFAVIGKWTGAFNILIAATVANMTLMVVLLKWHIVRTGAIYPYMLSAAAFGVCDSAWRSQLALIVGYVFTEHRNEMFSLKEFWEAVGYAISFVYGNHICIQTKIYIAIAWMAIGIILCAIVEYIHVVSKKRELEKPKLFDGQ